MDINWLGIHFTVILLLIFQPYQTAGKEQRPKQKNTLILCGGDFIKTYQTVCNVKKLKEFGGKRNKRSLNEQLTLLTSAITKYKKVNDLIDSKIAKSFLSPLHHHRRRRSDLLRDNASEECCYEGCTYAEIAEYPC